MDDEILVPNPNPAAIKDALIHDAGWKPDPIPDPETDWKLNPAKEGLDYDDCPRPECGNRDVDPLYRIGNTSTTFQCSCCGVAWNRESAEGHERNVNAGKGAFSKGRQMQSAAANRTVFTPSRLYTSNYERVFGHK